MGSGIEFAHRLEGLAAAGDDAGLRDALLRAHLPATA
jgi:hypothetical protein